MDHTARHQLNRAANSLPALAGVQLLGGGRLQREQRRVFFAFGIIVVVSSSSIYGGSELVGVRHAELGGRRGAARIVAAQVAFESKRLKPGAPGNQSSDTRE
jgi:hypothetical protein